MSSSIKVDKKLKTEIDKLQAKITIVTGEKVTQQELITRMMNFVKLHEEEFLKREIEDWKGVTKEELREIKKLISDFGKVTTEKTIDEELYGK